MAVHDEVADKEEDTARKESKELVQRMRHAITKAQGTWQMAKVTDAIVRASRTFEIYADPEENEEALSEDYDKDDWKKVVEQRHSTQLASAIKAHKKKLRPRSRSFSPAKREGSREKRKEEARKQRQQSEARHRTEVAREAGRKRSNEADALESSHAWAKKNRVKLDKEREEEKRHMEELAKKLDLPSRAPRPGAAETSSHTTGRR